MQKRGGKHIKYMSQMPSKDNSNKLVGRSNIELTIIDRNHSPHASMNRLVHGQASRKWMGGHTCSVGLKLGSPRTDITKAVAGETLNTVRMNTFQGPQGRISRKWWLDKHSTDTVRMNTYPKLRIHNNVS